MSRFGAPLARELGGDDDVVDIEHQALLVALHPGIDKDGPEQQAQAFAEACTVAIIWAVNERIEGNMVPAQMQETLPIWEEACGLRPLSTDTLIQRRAAVAAQFLSYVGNAISNLDAVCRQIAGTLFLGFAVIAPTAHTTYMPGLNPGPPGFEFSSTRAILVVQLQPQPAVTAAFLRTQQLLQNQLKVVAPSWLRWEIGTAEGGFLAGVGIAGLTLL